MRGGGSSIPGGEDNTINILRYFARPLQRHTEASFFNFSAGYVLGYWGNLNILLGTPNATITVFYYIVFALFCFLYSVFYLSSDDTGGACTWQSGLISTVVGVLSGMVLAQMIHPRVRLEDQHDHQLNLDGRAPQTRQQSLPAGVPRGSSACDADSNDMVCRAFRAG
jgi:hypothetical protein